MITTNNNYVVKFTATNNTNKDFTFSVELGELDVLNIGRFDLLKLFVENNEIEDAESFERSYLPCVSRNGLAILVQGGLCSYVHGARCNSYTSFEDKMARIPADTSVFMMGKSLFSPSKIFIGIPDKSGVWVSVEQK